MLTKAVALGWVQLLSCVPLGSVFSPVLSII